MLSRGGVQQGYIVYYENSGTNAVPVLEAGTYLQSEGPDLIMGEQWGEDCRADVTDWNEDGAWDLVVGDYGPGVYLFLGEPVTGIKNHGNSAKVTPVLYRHYTNDNYVTGINLKISQNISWKLYSVNGKLVRRSNLGIMPAGECVVSVYMKGLPRGVYFIKMILNNNEIVDKIYRF